MRYRILGPLEVLDDAGRPITLEGVKPRTILASLVVARNHLVSVDRIIDILWPEAPPASALNTIHSYVSRLRKSLAGSRPTAPLTSRKPGYVLATEPGEVDAEEFAGLVAGASDEATASRHEVAVAKLNDALALWRGRALSEFADQEFAVHEATRLEELRLTALEARFDSELALGRHTAAVPELEALAVAHPLRERLTAHLMLALYRSGRQADALRTYQAAYRCLVEELGVVPGPALRALEAAILAHDPAIDPPIRSSVLRARRAAAQPSLPRVLARAVAGPPFLGNAGAHAQVAAAWRRARDGEGGLVVLRGAGGAGKTRLAAEGARAAHADGATVLFGRALDLDAVPYQPVVEALADLFAVIEAGAASELVQAHPHLVSLLADLGPRHGVLVDAPADPGGRRYLMFQAIRAVLRDIGTGGGTVLVLDDLHAADQSTLSLVDHLARHEGEGRVLIVATLDDSLARRHRPVHELLTRLARDQLVHQIAVHGLDLAGTTALVEAVAGGPVTPNLARTIHERTGGNPFFVEEIARQLGAPDDRSRGRYPGIGGPNDAAGASGHAPLPVPARVRDAIEQRLHRFDPGVFDVLQAAAVVGAEFEVALLVELLGVGEGTVGPMLDAAIEAGVLEPLAAPDRLRFAHPVVFDALHASLTPVRRAQLRRRVAAAMASNSHDDSPARWAALAEHHRSAAADDARQSVLYAERAGDRAFEMLGFAEAIHHYDRALATLALLPDDDGEQRCRLLLRLGAAHGAQSDRDTTRQAFVQAADLAIALHLPEHLSEAAWGLVTVSEYSWQYPETIEVLRQALAVVGADDALRAKLCAGLSRALPAGQPEALALATTATRLADAVGDKETLAFALAASTVATWSPDNLEERLGAHSRIIELADVVGWVNLSAEARMWRSAGAEELGDFDAADADLAVLDHYARSSRRPLHSALRDLRRAGRALLRGEYAEAEQLAEATLHEVDAGPDFVSGYGAQLFALRRDQGRLGEIDTVVELAVAATPDIVAWRVPLLFVLLERGRRDEARAELEAIAADRFAGLTRDWLWLGTTALAADAVVALAHAAVAEVLYDLLLPFAGRHAVLAHGVLSFGAVARPLGALAALLGRTDEARHHLRHALEANRSVGAAPAVARTLVDLAGLEIGAGVPMASPTPLLDEATALVRRLGMDGLRPGLEAAGAGAGVG